MMVQKQFKNVGTTYLLKRDGVYSVTFALAGGVINDLEALLAFCEDFPAFYKEQTSGTLQK